MYKTVVEHLLTNLDSLPHLAEKYYKDSTRWLEIVEYNNLDYPYLIQDEEIETYIKASGYIKVERTQTVSDLVIPEGLVFSTESTSINPQEKTYVVKSETVIPAGESIGELFVVSSVNGAYGNTPSFSITTVKDNAYKSIFSNIYNELPLKNAKGLNVKLVGQKLYIPLDEGESSIENLQSSSTYLEELGQADLEVDSLGELVVDGSGDVSSLLGLDNIVSAVHHRLKTEAGELSRHQEYGTNIEKLVGKTYPYVEKLITVHILEAIQEEDRLDSAQVLSYEKIDSSLYVSLRLKLLGDTTRDIQIVF